MKICVKNIPFNSTEDEIRQAFAEFGTVATVKLINDKETGRPRGFGFVEMPDASHAQHAISALDGSEFYGREMRVEQARDRPQFPGGSRTNNRY